MDDILKQIGVALDSVPEGELYAMTDGLTSAIIGDYTVARTLAYIDDVAKVQHGIAYAELFAASPAVLRAARDEITRLRAENADLRDALLRATSGDPRAFGGF